MALNLTRFADIEATFLVYSSILEKHHNMPLTLLHNVVSITSGYNNFSAEQAAFT
jgi:hypothetical protein